MTKRMRAVVGGLLGAGGWLISSCSDTDTGTGPPPGRPACADSVTVEVTLDSLPLFSWTPDCTIGRLIVEQGFDEYWGTEMCGENGYRSPIRYSINPPSTCPEEPARDLAPGLTYKVSVWIFVPAPTESLQLLGSRVFTYLAPPPECTGPVTVSVTPDSLPIFSWTPDCAIGELVVEQGLDSFWTTKACGANTLPSPIRYSIDPPNACPAGPASLLVPGQTYTVRVLRFVSAVPESLELLGSANFVY